MSLLLSGCNDADRDQSSVSQQAVQSTADKSTPELATDGNTKSAASLAEHRERRLTQLQQELSSARAQRTHLQQRREEIDARISAHQEEGMQLLTSLKTRHQTEAGSDPAFEAAARSKLETALAQDTELTSAFEATDRELNEVDSRIDTLQTELNSLRDPTLQASQR